MKLTKSFKTVTDAATCDKAKNVYNVLGGSALGVVGMAMLCQLGLDDFNLLGTTYAESIEGRSNAAELITGFACLGLSATVLSKVLPANNDSPTNTPN